MKAITFFVCIELIASYKPHPENEDLPGTGTTVPASNLEFIPPISRKLQSNWQHPEWITSRLISSTAKESIATMTASSFSVPSILRTPSLPYAGIKRKFHTRFARFVPIPVNAPQPLTSSNSSSIPIARLWDQGGKIFYPNSRAFAMPYARPMQITPPKVLPTVDKMPSSAPPPSTVSHSLPIVLFIKRILSTPPTTSQQNVMVVPPNLAPLPEENYQPSGFATEYAEPSPLSQENTQSLNLLPTGYIKDDGRFIAMPETNPENVAPPHDPVPSNDAIISFGTNEVQAENTRPPIPSQGSGSLNTLQNVVLMKLFPSNAMNTTRAITVVQQSDPDNLLSLMENYQVTISPTDYPISTSQQGTQTLRSLPVHDITDGQFLASPGNNPSNIALPHDLEPLNLPLGTNHFKEVQFEYTVSTSTPLIVRTLTNLSVIELMNKIFTSASTATHPNTMATPSDLKPVASPVLANYQPIFLTGISNTRGLVVPQQNTRVMNSFPKNHSMSEDTYIVISEIFAAPNQSQSSNCSTITIPATHVPTDEGKPTATSSLCPEKLDIFTKTNNNNSLNGLSLHFSLTLQLDYDSMSTAKTPNSAWAPDVSTTQKMACDTTYKSGTVPFIFPNNTKEQIPQQNTRKPSVYHTN